MCDIWTRAGRYLGQVEPKTCETWPVMGTTAGTNSPTGAFQLAQDGNGRVQLRTRDAAVHGLLPADCEASHAAWAPDEKSLAVPCGATLRVFDTVSMRRVGELAVPKEWQDDTAKSLVYSRDVRFIVRADANSMTLWQWLPGHAAVKRTATRYAFDPITRETWEERIVMSDGRLESLGAADPAPGRTRTAVGGGDSEPAGSRQVGAWNMTGTAFTFIDALGHDSFSVGALALLGASPKGSVSFDDDPALHGVSLSQPTPRGDRAVVLTYRSPNMGGGVESLAVWLLTSGENRRLRASALTSAPSSLVVEEERALIAAGPGILVVPLDGRSEGVWMSPAERAAWHAPPQTRRFETTDGKVVRRLSDGATMNATNPCYWPKGWPDGDRVAVRVGGVFDAKFLPPAVVTRLFCAPALWEGFVRGDPMPPRPPAFVAPADAATAN